MKRELPFIILEDYKSQESKMLPGLKNACLVSYLTHFMGVFFVYNQIKFKY